MEDYELNKMYYLFSKTECLESIYFCDDGDYINNPTLQTGVYPMGTLLSSSIRILTPWFNNKFNPLRCEKDLSMEFENLLIQDSSFPNVTYEDSAVCTIFRSLLYDGNGIVTNRDHDKAIELLQSYMNYIALCQEERKFSSIEQLNLLSYKNGNELPQRSIYASNIFNEREILSKDGINNFLSDSNMSIQPFKPTPKKRPKPIFDLPIKQTMATPWGDLTTPIFVFKINDIIDLILASLQCIFEQNYVIGNCKYCRNLFVTHNQKRTYCPEQVTNKKSKSCREEAKLKRQLENEKKESIKLHKSLRTMFANKFDNTSLEYRNYIYDSEKWRAAIKACEATEEEYVEWLKGFYVRKYK
ncbi:MAG: hypothetical protein Q8876_08230 [Bacillota bacterium]|nr:hypothetical protein [Bacillota bacterium]